MHSDTIWASSFIHSIIQREREMLKKKTAFRLFNEYDELREGRITIPKYVEIFRVLEKEDEKADTFSRFLFQRSTSTK